MGICLKKNLVPRVPSLLERFFNGLVPCKWWRYKWDLYSLFFVNIYLLPLIFYQTPPSQIRLLSKKPPFQGKEINNTAILLSSSPLPSPLSLFCKTSFGGSGIICSRVRSSDLYSVILSCITSNFLYLCFPLCILILPVDWYHLM